MHEYDTQKDAYFTEYRDTLVSLYTLTRSHAVTAPPHLTSSFEFLRNEQIPPPSGDNQEGVEYAAHTARQLDYFIQSRERSQKIEELSLNNPLCSQQEILAAMQHFNPREATSANFYSVVYPGLVLTIVALFDHSGTSYTKRIFIQKSDELISETYVATYADELPIAIHKDIAPAHDKALVDADATREARTFFEEHGYDMRPAYLELRRLAKYLKEFSHPWEN